MDPVTHFEIPVDDMKRAQKFYQDAFGWTHFAPEGMEGMYEMTMTSETAEDMEPRDRGMIDGALFPREAPDEVPMITVEVDSIDEAVPRIEAAGGEIVVPPAPVASYGRYARFRDSEGNLLSLWEPAEQ